MIRYSLCTVLLLLAAFVVQHFLPAFTGLHHSRILLVQLVFLCCAVTVGSPAMLVLAFLGGFLWDAQNTLGPHGGDPEIYGRLVETPRFGYSILLFAAIGYLMQGLQPLFRQGKWQFSVLLCGIVIFVYLAAEFATISFVRGGFPISHGVLRQMLHTSLLTMLLSPLVFALLFGLGRLFNHPIHAAASRKRRAFR